MIVDGSSKYLTAYDGSGNLTALFNEANGAVEAAYEYGPFGEPLQVEGPYADANPFRFSTKYTDVESGMVYFGLRYYEPTTGRFINRDPIGEAGGLNLYGFVGNDPINRVDILGLSHNFLENSSEPIYSGFSVSFGVAGRAGLFNVLPGILQRTFFAGLRRFLGLLGAGQLGEDNMRGLADWDNISSEERFNIQLDIADASGLDGPQFSTDLIFFFVDQTAGFPEAEEKQLDPQRVRECDEARELKKIADSNVEWLKRAHRTGKSATEIIDAQNKGGTPLGLAGYKIFGVEILGASDEIKEQYSQAIVDIVNDVELDNKTSAFRHTIFLTGIAFGGIDSVIYGDWTLEKLDISVGRAISYGEVIAHQKLSDKLSDM